MMKNIPGNVSSSSICTHTLLFLVWRKKSVISEEDADRVWNSVQDAIVTMMELENNGN